MTHGTADTELGDHLIPGNRTTLALLGVFEFDNGRTWMCHDFDVIDRLYVQGMISDPHNRNQSVHLTPEGLARAKALADAWFGASTAH